MARRPLATLCAALALAATAACSGSSGHQLLSTTTTTPPRSGAPGSPSTTTAPPTAPQRFFVVPLPSGVDPGRFGRDVAVTTAADGRPVVAFAIAGAGRDPAQVVTATFDDATSEFRPTVTVATAALASAEGSIGIARDDSGALVVAWDDAGAIVAATSHDDGASWQRFAVAAGTHPSVAAAGGAVGIGFTGPDGRPALATTDLAGARVAVTPAPPEADGRSASTAAPAVAAVSGGFGLAYAVQGGLRYLPPGAPAASVVVDGDPAATPAPSVALAAARGQPVLGATFCRAASSPAPCTIVAASSDGGMSFAAPVDVPPDGGAGAGFLTRLVVDAQGAAALAYLANTGDSSERCGEPKLAVSPDLAAWQTCSPDPDRSLRLESGVPALATAPQGGLVLAFQQTNTNAGAPAGVLVAIWSAVPAGGTSPV